MEIDVMYPSTDTPKELSKSPLLDRQIECVRGVDARILWLFG